MGFVVLPRSLPYPGGYGKWFDWLGVLGWDMAEALFWLCFWVSQYSLSPLFRPWPHFLLHPDIWLSAGPPVPSFPGGGGLLLGRLGVWTDRTGTKYSIGRQVTINLTKPLNTKTWTKLLQLQVGKPALPVCVMQSIALIFAVFGAYELANNTDRTFHPMSTPLARLTFWLLTSEDF